MTKNESPYHPNDDTKISVLFDMNQLKPACVLIQALSCNSVDDIFANDVVHLFRNWETNVSAPGFKKISATWKEWKQFAKEVREGKYEAAPQVPETEGAEADPAADAP